MGPLGSSGLLGSLSRPTLSTGEWNPTARVIRQSNGTTSNTAVPGRSTGSSQFHSSTTGRSTGVPIIANAIRPQRRKSRSMPDPQPRHATSDTVHVQNRSDASVHALSVLPPSITDPAISNARSWIADACVPNRCGVGRGSSMSLLKSDGERLSSFLGCSGQGRKLRWGGDQIPHHPALTRGETTCGSAVLRQ